MCVYTSSAMTGRKMMMVAVLLAISVKQAMKAVMRITATGGGTCARGCKWLPIHTANPDSYSQSKTYISAHTSVPVPSFTVDQSKKTHS